MCSLASRVGMNRLPMYWIKRAKKTSTSFLRWILPTFYSFFYTQEVFYLYLHLVMPNLHAHLRVSHPTQHPQSHILRQTDGPTDMRDTLSDRRLPAKHVSSSFPPRVFQAVCFFSSPLDSFSVEFQKFPYNLGNAFIYLSLGQVIRRINSTRTHWRPSCAF